MIKSLSLVALPLFAFAPAVRALGGGPGEQPDYSATCPSPQQINSTSVVFANGNAQAPQPVVFNGTDFAVIYPVYNDSKLHFHRLFADGSPAGPDVIVAGAYPANYQAPAAMVWNGTGYAVAWETIEATHRVLFALLDANGTVISGPTAVSSASVALGWPALAWNPAAGQYLVAYEYHFTATDWDIYASLLNSSGAVTNSTITIYNPGQFQKTPAVATYSQFWYDIVWSDNSGIPGGVYGLRSTYLSNTGTVGTVGYAVTPSAYNQTNPSLASSPNNLGLAYIDNADIYFARENLGGPAMTTPIRATAATIFNIIPQLSYNGTEYALVWDNFYGSVREAYMQRVNPNGSLAGGNTVLTNSVYTAYPSLAFGRHGYLLHAATGYDETVTAIGCVSDGTPPACAGNYLASNIAPTSATISWLPGDDAETDIAYYQVYQNNAPLARTATASYNVTGLTNGSTYNFAIRPVNAAALVNAGCNESLYLKAGVGPSLTLGKNAASARLDWTSLGWNSYNVFRGTDARVQNLLAVVSGLTASDPVLDDGVSYFYTVDDPGQ